MGNLKWVAAALGILVVLFLVSRSMQSGYTTRPDAIFPEQTDAITTVTMWNSTDTLTLQRVADSTWTIVGEDSLEVIADRIKYLMRTVLPVKKETLVSQNPEKWETFTVTDSAGWHLEVFDASGTSLAHAIFGRSATDWSHNYVRLQGEDEVYLTDRDIIYSVYPRPTYWGQKRKPAVVDSAVTAGEQ